MIRCITTLTFGILLLCLASGCCEQRTTASPTLGDNIIVFLNSNHDLPVAGCALAKQSYHLLSSRDRERVKAMIELQTKNERDDVRKAAAQTLADLHAFDKVL